MARAWTANWIYLDQSYFAQWRKAPGLPPVIFSKEIMIKERVQQATAYISALGVYQMQCNGRPTDDYRLAPGWTDYNKRIQYQQRDLTPFLTMGKNNLKVTVGDGWYVGNIAVVGRNQYGRYPLKLILELVIEYEDGSTELIRTDESWLAGTGAIQYSDLQTGEYYDANQECSTRWKYAEIYDMGTKRLVPQQGPELAVKEILKPASFVQRQDSVVIDMGQNMVGVLEIRWRGQKGQKVQMVHGEMLRADGSVYTENLRTASQTDVYVFKGEKEETFEPLFTIHGFRYVEVFGLRQEDILEVKGKVIYADIEKAGEFFCSDERINRLYQNIVWGQKGNFNSAPTDCPQRDERMGWTGDAQIFAATACYNMDCRQYFRKYITDIMDAQLENGTFPDVAPLVRRQEGMGLVGVGHAAWGDAGIIIPWTLYRFYGDKEVLGMYYPQMERHMQFVLKSAPGGIRDDEGYGDWLNVSADTPKAVMATAFMAYCLKIMSKISETLDKMHKKLYYEECLAEVKKAFAKKFVNEDGKIYGDTQTCYVLALKFDLLDPGYTNILFKQLVRKIKENGNKLNTGFIGVSYLLPILCKYGGSKTAYDLLFQEEYPSWLYSVNNGATTIWERWNSYTYEHGFADIAMNSFNHYSLGSVGEWLFSCLGGICQEDGSAGFDKLIIKPFPDRRLEWARVKYRLPSGMVEVFWRTKAGKLELNVELPQEAKIVLPDGKEHLCASGRHSFSTDF